jgi:hypothetical protein
MKTSFDVLFRLRRSAEKRQRLGLKPSQIDGAIEALKQDSSKQLLGFHYFEDPLAEFEKFEWLRQRLGAGVRERFRAVALAPQNSSGVPDWCETLSTTEKRKLTGPHMTLGGLNKLDREQLRKVFARVITPSGS